MNVRERLVAYGRKTITLEAFKAMMNIGAMDEKTAYERISGLLEEAALEPVKSSGTNGNVSYPLYKKYRILLKSDADGVLMEEINRLHPLLLRSGYLSAEPAVFQTYKSEIRSLSTYLFREKEEIYISRKERSYEIFGREKVLDDSGIKALLRKLRITETDLKFYDTPEYCFHDYIPVRKEKMTLLICENKDIWFNIRRCMFEEGTGKLFDTALDGVVYGEGNKISNKKGALEEYVKFMGNPEVTLLYWGDIDREGFDIFRRTREANHGLKLSLFVPGYRTMMERARNREIEDSPSSRKQGESFEDLIHAFSPEEQIFLRDIFDRNKLIPQEIITYKDLRNDWRKDNASF